MIVAEKKGDVFGAEEELLLVPLSSGPYRIPGSSFAQEVATRFPLAEAWLKNQLDFQALQPGGVRIYSEPSFWAPAYTLAYAGLHQPGDRGWEESPACLEIALYQMPERRLGRTARIAVAGIPGTGFSGLKGGADPQAIRHALEASSREIVIYHRASSGDREPLHDREQPPSVPEFVPLPR